MTRRLAWFSLGVASAPLAWGVAHVAYIAVDDWLHERKFRRSLGTELAEVEDRLATLCEDAGGIADALSDPPVDLTLKVLRRIGHDLADAVERAREPTR